MENHLHCPVCLSGILEEKISNQEFKNNRESVDYYAVYICGNYDCRVILQRKNLEKIERVFNRETLDKPL